ncbi:hypothetical protein DDZ18_12080 [Marinicauda salina]|uniref:DUF4440 domain-containing protein n=1 Tax=Marinicauda salina TaxID=2135793 RepID=A0A2U2BR69_9PROT|nr:nuclear transport factor 2 family protein [Marinicauda salina]PWE16503.1 hypothetical protein DDZ18_12080 [Marinicauda salina]
MGRMRTMLAACALACLSSAHADQPTEESAIRARADAWMEAMEAKDADTLDAVMAEEYALQILGGPNARVPRAEWIENATSSDWVHHGFRRPHVTVHDDVAVMVSSYAYKSPWRPPLPPTPTRSLVIDIWEQQGGEWRVVRRYAGLPRSMFWTGGVLLVVLSGLVFGTLGWLLGRRRRG